MNTVPLKKNFLRTAATVLLPAFAFIGVAANTTDTTGTPTPRTNPVISDEATKSHTAAVTTKKTTKKAPAKKTTTKKTTPAAKVTPTKTPAKPAAPKQVANPAFPAAFDSSPIATLVFNKVNAYRVANGVPALTRHAGMEAVSTSWSAKMAAANRLAHNPDYRTQVPSGHSRVGENAAFTSTLSSDVPDEEIAEDLFQLWVNSAPHRANMLDARYNYGSLGIGRNDNGVVYATQNFARY